MAEDDLADELQSLSFSSSGRSASDLATSSSSGSSSSSSLRLSDLRLLRRLGSGDIGSVYLAEIRCGGERRVVAAKVMDKKELQGRNKEERARAELAILQMLDHPFLPRLYGCADNHKWSCLITEFCPGGDLHILRQRQPARRFPEPAVRFYAAEVVAALEYLHMMGVVYRDLKPENVLVRSDGHIMLTDFDLSLKCDSAAAAAPAIVPASENQTTCTPQRDSRRHTPPTSCILPSCIVPAVSCLQPKQHRRRRRKMGILIRRRRDEEVEFVAEPVNVRSMSFVGTHEYLAPEIVSGEGHGSAVDWWTVGVFVFELLYGFTPFRGVDNDATLANIVARALEFPKDPPVPHQTREFLSGLLAKDPARRLGSATGAAALKRHPFFAGVSWALLRCAKPPYLPPPMTEEENAAAEADEDSAPGTPVEFY